MNLQVKLLAGLLIGGSIMPISQAAEPKTETLIKYKGIALGAEDVRAELDLLDPEKRANILTDGSDLQSTVTGLYFRKRMSQLAESQGLLAEPEVQVALEQARETTLAKIMTDRYLEDIDYPSFDTEARSYYEENLDEFTPPERIRAAHIFLQAPKATDKEARRGEAEGILNQLRNGADFSGLAKAHSEDSSRHMGGDLGYFTRERMVPEFNKVAFSMNESGEISEVIETRFGLHIVKLLDRTVSEPKPFESVVEQIKQRLKTEYKHETFSSWLKREVPPNVVGLSKARLRTLQDTLAEHFGVMLPDAQISTDSESTTVVPSDAVTP